MDEVDACGNNEIIAAARDRDWNRVRELLKKGADVRNCNCFGQNALFFAVLNCRFELADELYQRGARLSGLIDNPDSEMLAGIADMMRYGRNPFYDENNTLAECCRDGHYDQAESLLERASPDEKNQALRALIRNGNYRPERNLELFRRLLAAGADPGDKTGNEYNCRELLEVIGKRPYVLTLNSAYAEEVERLIS